MISLKMFALFCLWESNSGWVPSLCLVFSRPLILLLLATQSSSCLDHSPFFHPCMLEFFPPLRSSPGNWCHWVLVVHDQPQQWAHLHCGARPGSVPVLSHLRGQCKVAFGLPGRTSSFPWYTLKPLGVITLWEKLFLNREDGWQGCHMGHYIIPYMLLNT